MREIRSVTVWAESTGTSVAKVLMNDGCGRIFPSATKRIVAAIPIVIERYQTTGEEVCIKFEVGTGDRWITDFASNPIKPRKAAGSPGYYVYTKQCIHYIDYWLRERNEAIYFYAQNVEPYTVAPKAGLKVFYQS